MARSDTFAAPKRTRSSQVSSADLFDELLVTLVQQGDRAAAERLFRRWNPRLLRSARRYTGDAAQAEQLAQDCWEGIWRGIAGLRQPSYFPAWAFGIMRRKGADQIAIAIKERDNLASDDDALTSRAAGLPPSADDRAAINQAFARLPPDQRLAAHLYFVEGLTLPEIAAVQSIPTGTAKSRLFHARRKLKAALNPDIPQEKTHDR